LAVPKPYTMKKSIYFLVSSCLCLSAFATIRTVSNLPSPQAQFNAIQPACDASSSGDSIYVLGSPNSYASFTINNKKLAIFGPGWNPNKDANQTAIVAGCTLTGVGATGSELHGLSFTGNVTISTIGINEVKFMRNRFYPSVSMSLTPTPGGVLTGYFFEGNWFDDSRVNSNGSYTLSNFLFKNNIFFNNIQFGYSIAGFVNCSNVLFDHNLWWGATNNFDCFSSNCRFLTLSNNIFIHRNAYNSNSNSSFNNNLTFLTNNDAPGH
jgi:hypothetical protein